MLLSLGSSDALTITLTQFKLFKLFKATYSTFGKAPGEAPVSIVKTEYQLTPSLGIMARYAEMN